MPLPTKVCGSSTSATPFDAAQRELDHVLSRFFGNRGFEGVATSAATYGVDVREDADHLYVEAEVPGFTREQVDVTLENQTLTITARRDEKSDQTRKGDWLLNERRHQSFQRSFTLPTNISDNKVDAKLSDGILTITLDKREESKPRKIPVG